MLRRELRYSEDSFAAFFRLGAQCWGPRVADPVLAITLADEDPEKVARRKLNEALVARAMKRKEQLALYRRAKRAKHFAGLQARRQEKQKKREEQQKKKQELQKKKEQQKKIRQLKTKV